MNRETMATQPELEQENRAGKKQKMILVTYTARRASSIKKKSGSTDFISVANSYTFRHHNL